MILLLACLAALWIGPLVYAMTRSRPGVAAMIDGFLLATIAGTVLTSILPRILHDGDWLALGMLVIGFFVPGQVEHWFTRAARGAHRVTLGLAFVGLAFHQMFDGGALAFFSESKGPDTVLAAGVVLHQVPVGLLVWWVLRRRPALVPALLLLGLGALIVVGYAVQVELGTVVPASVTQAFTALIGGSLLHVLGHDPAAHEEEPAAGGASRDGRRLGAVGAVIGLVVLFFVSRASQVIENDQTTGALLDRLAVLSLEAAPALLLAYLVAGLLSVFAAASPAVWLGRGSQWSQAMRGVLVGLPLPLCSCSVVPLYRTLVNGGASAAGAMAFLIAGPELGVDAVLLSVPLLGTEFTVIRVVAAIVVALLVGRLVGGAVRRRGLPVLSGDNDARRPLEARLWDGLKLAFGENVDRTAPWILFGMLIAAMLGPDAIGRVVTALPLGVDVAVLGLIGIPIYVCASAATPLVAALVAAGVSPGAGLAFLITGPATNLTTFGVLGRLHGKRTALAFSGAVLGFSIGLGLVVNATFPGLRPPLLAAAPAEAATALKVASLAALVLLVLASLWRQGIRGFLAELSFGKAEGAPADGHGHAH